MAWTIEKALEDDAIESTEITHSGYSFWLKGIPVEVSVVLSLNPAKGGFNFRLSHFIHTPNQIGPYHPSLPWGDDAAYALHRAVDAIASYYKAAVKEGHTPKDSWLVPNQSSI